MSVLEVFRDHVLLILLSTRSVSAFSTANTFILGVFQDFILRGAVILAVFQGFLLRGTAG